VKFSRDDSDVHLAACAKAGERGAFEVLVERNKNTIYHFVRRYVGQSDDAYDVLQDCFIAAWNGLCRYDPGRPFLPWLRIIALNKCRDFGRRQAVRRLVLETFSRQPGQQDRVQCDYEAEAEAEAKQDRRLGALDKAIAALPAFYKEPLLLAVVSGISHEHIAKMLETTPKAVEMRLYRARKKLFDAMQSKIPEG
jgi:RNA polymerase sigma factor (sigma-70 family)